MELLDLYDENREFTGRTIRRGEPIPAGDRILVVVVFTKNSHGELLMTLRSPEKEACPNTWENNGGAAQHGEDSRVAIQRELMEETGIQADQKDFILLRSYTFRDSFLDVYLLEKDVPLTEIRLQPHETVDARWCNRSEYEKVIAAGLMAPPVVERYEDLKEVIWT